MCKYKTHKNLTALCDSKIKRCLNPTKRRFAYPINSSINSGTLFMRLIAEIPLPTDT